MANSNVNIAQRLFAYIKHKVDINEDIKQIYENSLIFIGDEQQIYVPTINTYVGMGVTSYNVTNQRIDDLKNQLEELANTMSSDIVSKIYANYSKDEFNTYGNYTGTIWPQGADYLSMNNYITFKGVGNYEVDPSKRPATGGNVVTSYELTLNDDDHTHLVINSENILSHQDYTQSTVEHFFDPKQRWATSGITITPHYGELVEVENPITHQIIKKQQGNYITIDDTQTWSYMTSAYAYTMSFAQHYTDVEVDRIYHDILGMEEATYIPVPFDQIFKKIELGDFDNNGDPIVPEGAVQIGNDYYQVVVDPDRQYFTRTKSNDPNGSEPYNSITTTDLVDFLTAHSGNLYVYDNFDDVNNPGHNVPESLVGNYPQIYVLDPTATNTYNMNLRDGINTLKEVAYLLDQLSDGQLGETTYITYGQYTDAYETQSADAANFDENEFYATYHLIIPRNQHPANDDLYAYYVVSNPENLGITIAYSIAGNQKQIDDLHHHTELIESGRTNVRSIQSTQTNLASIVMTGGSNEWVNTDTNQIYLEPGVIVGGTSYNSNYPNIYTQNSNANHIGKDYRVGDIDLKLSLDLAQTYITVNTQVHDLSETYDNRTSSSNYGVEYVDDYKVADMTQIHAGVSYYTYNVTTGDFDLVAANDLITNYRDLPVDNDGNILQYYWKPTGEYDPLDENSIKTIGDDVNSHFKYISEADLANVMTSGVPRDPASMPYLYAFNKTTKKYVAVCTPSGTNDNSVLPTAGLNWYSNYDPASSDYINYDRRLFYVDKVDEYQYNAYIIARNQLATTDWVGAYMDARVGDIASDLEDILEQAKKYTDEKIAELDTNYIYSDFDALYWDNQSVEYTEGSEAYKLAYLEAYQRFVNGQQLSYSYHDAGNNLIEGTFNEYADTLRNTSRSEYLYNVTEEDGIISGEGRELPSDRIVVETEIWGAETSSTTKRFQYSVLESQNNDSSLLTTLYNWVHSTTTDDPANQLFVIDGETFEKISPEETLTGNDYAYVFNSATGLYSEDTVGNILEYTAYTSSGATISMVADYADTSHFAWRQLYRKAPKFVELDLDSAELLDPTVPTVDVSTINVLLFNNRTYTLTKDTTTGVITVSGNSCPSATAAELESVYYISAQPTGGEKVEYLTSGQKHFTYENGGHGENELTVKANIVKLEDASATNTGFADAFDVKTYIDNLFKWVDISASVDETTLITREAFYKHITYDEYINMATTPTIYGKNASDQFVVVASPATAYYYFSDNYFAGTTSQEVETHKGNRGAVTVNGAPAYARLEFNAQGFAQYDSIGQNVYDSSSDYYIRIEEGKINPRNLILTRYGEPTTP